jgi:hypothetical protein
MPQSDRNKKQRFSIRKAIASKFQCDSNTINKLELHNITAQYLGGRPLVQSHRPQATSRLSTCNVGFASFVSSGDGSGSGRGRADEEIVIAGSDGVTEMTYYCMWSESVLYV